MIGWYSSVLNLRHLKITFCYHTDTKYCTRAVVKQAGGGAGGQSAPQKLLTRKFLLTYWEKRGKEKKGKW